MKGHTCGLVLRRSYKVLLWGELLIHCITAFMNLKVIHHPLYGMNNYVLIWGDWLSCDRLRGSHDSQSPRIWG